MPSPVFIESAPISGIKPWARLSGSKGWSRLSGAAVAIEQPLGLAGLGSSAVGAPQMPPQHRALILGGLALALVGAGTSAFTKKKALGGGAVAAGLGVGLVGAFMWKRYKDEALSPPPLVAADLALPEFRTVGGKASIVPQDDK